MAAAWTGTGAGAGPALGTADAAPSARGVLQAAGFLFFAFAGYARIATLVRGVRNPARTIPRAIPLALGITVAVQPGPAGRVVPVVGLMGCAALALALPASSVAAGAATLAVGTALWAVRHRAHADLHG